MEEPSFLDKLQKAWANPPKGLSLIGMARSMYDAAQMPGQVLQYGGNMSQEELTRAGIEFAMNFGAGGSLVPKPTNSLGIFGGRLAKTANLEKLTKAEQFEKAGVDPDTIWKATGWGRGKDNKWRFEIDDSKAALKPDARERLAGSENALGSTLGSVYHHPELFKAYPGLEDALRIGFMKDPKPGNLGQNLGRKVELNPNRDMFQMDSTMLHELQHTVQNLEDFAKGNNAAKPKEYIKDSLLNKWEGGEISRDQYIEALNKLKLLPDDKAALYRQSAGEVEARSVQARMAYNKLKRAIRSPWRDEDVPRQSQIPFGFRNE
jgi:hypothetical protein